MNDEIYQAKQSVFRLLKYRDRSEKELRDKLIQKGFSASSIQKVLGYVKDIGLVDHHKFAHMWINARLKRPFGIRRIRQELVEKGIEPEIIDEQLKTLTQESYQEEETVYQLAEHRLKLCGRIDKEKAKQRISGYLMRRGFAFSSIKKALEKLFKDVNVHY